VLSLSWDQVRARRLARSHLIKPASRDRIAEVVGDVCGIQAQVMVAAELALAARVEGLTQKEVRAELWVQRNLVKTYGPRGTLHLLPADELPTWMAALRAIPNHHGAMWNALTDVAPGQVEQLVAATREVLDGRQLTRDELAGDVSQLVGAWARKRLGSMWSDLLAPAAMTGALCFAPSEGIHVRFVRADQWIGGWRDEDPHAALLKVLRRFVAAYGPTTPQLFASWFATTPATAGDLFNELADELVPVEVERKRMWMLAGDAAMPFPAPSTVVRLVPQYDCFVLGSRPREQLIRESAQTRIRSYRRGRYEGAVALPTLLVDGFVTGIWERRKRGGGVEITVEGIEGLTRSQRIQLTKEATRIGAFFGAEASLTVGTLA
jgi:winged helix DNA-binding protein